MMRMTKKTWPLFAIFGVFALVIAGIIYQKTRPSAPPEIHGLVLNQGRSIGPLTLQQAPNGDRFTEKNFIGKWSLVFFGYTYCPDVCPNMLGIMNQVWQELEKKNALNNIQFIFVSIDPERDSLKKLQEYVTYFNSSFIGITAEKQQLSEFTKKLGIVYEKDSVSRGPDNYLINHSSAIVVINPNGQYQAFFSTPHDPQNIANDLIALKKHYG